MPRVTEYYSRKHKSYQDYNSSIYQLFDTQSNLNDPDYINDVQYRFNDAYLGVHYKFISGKFTFNPVSIHQYNTNNVQLNSKQEDNFSRFCLMFALPPNQKV
jgi:hypothetical protein